MSKVGLIQMTSSADPQHNLNYIELQMGRLAQQGVDWVIVPENALVFGYREDYHRHAEPLNQGKWQTALAQLASRYQMWLLVGSFPIAQDDTVTTTSLLYSAQGQLVAHYSKLHMFDVNVEDGHRHYRESDTFHPGNALECVETPFGCVGLTICYDLRFPALFGQLRHFGADIIVVPAAFTTVTGEAHWQSLVRARAIETQCWILAVGQVGLHPCGRETWGHSMVVDPWGKVVASLTDQADNLVVDLDMSLLDKIRTNMPITQHSRFECHLKK